MSIRKFDQKPLSADAIAGFTFAIVNIPQGMANHTAAICGLCGDSRINFAACIQIVTAIKLSPPGPPKGGERRQIPPFGGLGGLMSVTNLMAVIQIVQ